VVFVGLVGLWGSIGGCRVVLVVGWVAGRACGVVAIVGVRVWRGGGAWGGVACFWGWWRRGGVRCVVCWGRRVGGWAVLAFGGLGVSLLVRGWRVAVRGGLFGGGGREFGRDRLQESCVVWSNGECGQWGVVGVCVAYRLAVHV